MLSRTWYANQNACDYNLEECPFPFPVLSRAWYTNQNSFNYDLEECSLPFPELSSKWYKLLSEDLRSETLEEAFPLLSQNWYKRRGQLARKNHSRKNSVESDETDLTRILHSIETTCNSKSFENEKKIFMALLQSVKFFSENGPVVLAQDMIKCYTDNSHEADDIRRNYMAPATFVSKLRRFGAFKTILVFGRSFILVSKNNDFKRLHALLNTIPENSLSSEIKDTMTKKIGESFQTVLKMASTKDDADLIKGKIFSFSIDKILFASSFMWCSTLFADKHSLHLFVTRGYLGKKSVRGCLTPRNHQNRKISPSLWDKIRKLREIREF